MLPQLVATWSICLIAVVSSQAPATPTPNANYAIVCTRVLRLGEDYRIGVALFPRSDSHGIESVTARLNTSRKGEKFSNVTAEAAWRREAGKVSTAAELTLLVSAEPRKFDPAGSYKLEVSIVDSLGNRYTNSTDVTLSYPAVVTLIQTDKAVYKPGQLVKFRVVNVDESLKPVLANMEVLIKDSQSNLVDKLTHNLTDLQSWSDKAVMTGQFQLSEMPNEGDWTIAVKSEHGTEFKTFNVRQYVLPKFTMELSLPSFVHFNDSEFTVRAKVLYTFDKAVEGTFNATIGPFMDCPGCKDRYDKLRTFTADSPANGEASFTFDMASWRESLRAKRIEFQHHQPFFMAKAEVQFKEKFTGETKQAAGTFTIHRMKYNLKIETSQVSFFLPGFAFPVQVSLLQPDNKPFTGKPSSNATVSITYQQRGKLRVLEVFRGALSASPAGTGVSLNVKIPATSDFQQVQVDARILGNDLIEQRATTTVHPFIGITDDYVQVSKNSVHKDAESCEMEISKSAGIRHTFYSVLSRGQLQQWAARSSDAKLTFTKSDLRRFVSDVTVVAFGLAENGEIVASALKHEMTRFGGNVSMKSNLTLDKGEPQKWTSLSVMADPSSFVFVTGIDASVNLLATGQDILQTMLADRYKSRVLGSRYWPRPQRLTTGKIIQEKGLVVLSDAFYYTEHGNRPEMYGTARGRSMMAMSAKASNDGVPPPGAPQPMVGASGSKTQVRKFFPETMVWTVLQVNSEGHASHAFQLPDTITSWHLTGFGVADGKQIQTMDEAFKVTTFKNFFIRQVLPYSIVRGEKFLLKVQVFNYRDTAGKVTVALTFNGTDADAKVAAGQTTSLASDAKKLPSIEVSVQGNSAGQAIFELTPRSLPSLELTVTATYVGGSYTETDVVVKSVIVVPEGKTVYQSRSVLLTPPASGISRPEYLVSIDYPTASADMVPGSEVFTYSLIGDVMGPAMQNIDGLLRLPSGCGEQNMVNFAPAVFIWEYLSSTKQENSEVKEKALRIMKTGLQRQLTYKRLDGSYSAFGEEDQAGSTWLTAFVLSIYARASAFIAIEPDTLTGNSVKFLIERQSQNGQFTEPPGGRVLDRSLQGSSAQASHGMTASVCLALLDIDEVARAKPDMQSTIWKDFDVKGSISKCLWYVKNAFDSNAAAFSSYDIALSAYLLRRAQAVPSFSQTTLQSGLNALQAALNAQAETTSSGGKFWSTTDPYWRQKSGSVEATSWALLGSTLAGNTEESLQILRWLSNQQSSLGGFQTSQATVVGIRALSAFAAKSGLVSGDAGIELVVNGMTQAHTVKEGRRLVLTQGQLLRDAKARVGSVAVRHAAGTGFAVVKLSWQYNLLDRQPLSAEWKSASGLGIRLGAPSSPAPSGQFRLNVCARANSSEGMLILRVTNPSGYSPSELPQLSDAWRTPGLKRVESGPQEVVMYFDYIGSNRTAGVCLTIGWTREVPVLDLSPQLISLQKYYNTEQIVSASYLAPELKSLSQCAVCPDCPACSSKATWLSWFI